MDVTSLLNTARTSSYRGGCVENSPSPHQPNRNTTVSPAIVSPRPSIRDSREISNRYKRRNAKFWDARDATAPQIDESDCQSRRTCPPVSPKQINKVVFESNNRLRQFSTDPLFCVLSPPQTHLTRHGLYCDDDQTSSTRMTHQDHRACYPGEMSTASRHKLSFSNSSLASSESPVSECHSRLSSVASVSGMSSTSIPVMEMLSIDATSSTAQNPQLDLGVTLQPPSPPLTEESSTAIQSRLSRIKYFSDSLSDPVPNLENSGTPLLFWVGIRSDLATRPKYHKRATSAPVLASLSATPAPITLEHHYPVPRSSQTAMDESAEKGSPIRVEEPEPTIITTRQGFDEPERRTLNHYTGRNRHAGEVVDRLAVCEANPQTQGQVLDLASDITPPLTQPDGSMAREASLEALSATSAMLLEEEPRCMFVDDCQTGSQLRKAISHLFGRNKACTLRIPKHVWVYYCRKHYQRIRYRNAKTYPLNQMHLVTMQINRLQKWSDENQRQGLGPYIKLWTLTLRKREQNRLDKEGGAIDEGDEDSPETQYGSAAPEWIIERLGTGYTTEQMLEVAERLYREIEDGTLSQVPEIEFLPDIIESEVRNMVKLVKSRKQARTAATLGEIKAPKRKISEAADTLHQSNSSLSHQHDTDEPESPSRKRVHLSPPQSNGHQQPHQMPLPSIVMPAYASSRAPMPSTDFQSAIPRSLPVIPRMRVSSASHTYGPDAHLHGLSSSEFQRPSPFNSIHSYDPQQYSTHYHPGIDSARQSPPFPRDGDHHSYQRLPSISAHLSRASDFHGPNLTIPPFRISGASSGNLIVPRPPHLRSYSDNLPTAQPPFEYPRPASSSGAVQSGLTCFDDRATGSSTHQVNNRGYSREQWPEPDHSYAASGSQGSAPQQQQNCYPSSAIYGHTAHPQMDDGPRASAYLGPAPGPLLGPAPTLLGPTQLGATSGRVEHEARRYGNAWPHVDQVVTRATREAHED